MKTEKIHISKIKPNPKNPRLRKDNAFEKLKTSLKELPEMQEIREIIIDENNMILGGNMRYKALKDLGEKYVYVKKVENLTEEQKQDFIIKDNLNYGEWDFEILEKEFKEHSIKNGLAEINYDEIIKFDNDLLSSKEIIKKNSEKKICKYCGAEL